MFFLSVKDVIFLGSKGVGHHCLNHLLINQTKLGIRVTAVLTNDRKIKPDDLSILDLCDEYDIPVLAEMNDLLTFDRPDFLISVQYHQILKEEHIGRAKELAMNLHMAPLPEYRGCNQFSFAIIDGVAEFGTTLHVMGTGIDSGDILFERRFPIEPDCMVADLYEKTLIESKQLFENDIVKIFSGDYKKITQDSLVATRGTSIHYRKEIDEIKQFERTWSEEKILRYFRATYFPPFPPPYFYDKGEKIEVTPNWIEKNTSSPNFPDFSNIVKPEPTFRYMAAVFVSIGLFLLVSSFSTMDVDGLMLAIMLFGLGIIFELIYLNKSKEYKTKIGESTKRDPFTSLLGFIVGVIVTFAVLFFLTPFGYILGYML